MRPVLKPLSRQTLVITGATSGIGLETARLAAKRGAAVLLVARDEAALQRVASELRAAGGRADVFAGDVGDEATAQRVVEAAVDRFGGFDTWINDAGVGIYGELATLATEEHRRMFETNYWGMVYGSQAAIAHLKARGGGALITLGSVVSDMPAPIQGAYVASKHAVKGYTNSLRIETLRDGLPISITLIKPSAIGTPFPQNARNDTDGRASLPPPLYAPNVVAEAILYAAVNVRREITVGGGGRAQAIFAAHAPALFERLATLIAPKISIPGEANDSVDSLEHPGIGGEAEGREHGRPFSLYTSAQTHPRLVAGVALGLALGIAAAAVALNAGAFSAPEAVGAKVRKRVRKAAKPLQRRGAKLSRGLAARFADALHALPSDLPNDVRRRLAAELSRTRGRIRSVWPL